MQRLLVTAAVLAFSLSAVGAGSAVAAPCKDMHGKFMKCPPMKPMKPMRCKDGRGKFMKCGMPGARRSEALALPRGGCQPLRA